MCSAISGAHTIKDGDHLLEQKKTAQRTVSFIGGFSAVVLEGFFVPPGGVIRQLDQRNADQDKQKNKYTINVNGLHWSFFHDYGLSIWPGGTVFNPSRFHAECLLGVPVP